MKKKWANHYLLSMKLTFALVVCSLFHVSATVYSQNAKVDLHVEKTKISTIVKTIERQLDFEYRFVYNADEFPADKRVSLNVKQKPLVDLLPDLLAGTGFQHQLLGEELIVFTPIDKEVPQLRWVSGKVTDSAGVALQGVSIRIQGSSKGVTSRSDGYFELEAPDGAVLVFSYVGYVSKEVTVGSDTSIRVILEAASSNLDEVVIVGYGTLQKSDLTGSVGSIGEKTLRDRPVTNLPQAIAGTIPGVSVSVNSGRPGGRPTVRVRGNSSITGINDPLYVIDGIILNVANLSNGTSPIDYLEPAYIESVEILKDASATAIYGARGANGVVLITTKKGSSQGGTLNYDTYLGLGKLAKKLDVLDAEAFLKVEEIAYANANKFGLGGLVADPALKRTDTRLFDADGNPLYDTDWQREGFQTAFSNIHHLSFAGGDENNKYALNLGYRDEDGILRTSSLARYTGRLTIDLKINEWLNAGGLVDYSKQDENQPQQVGSGGISPTRSILQAIPIIPVRYPNGDFSRTLDYPGMEGGDHPLRLVDEQKRFLNSNNVLGSAFANLKLAEGLEFRTSVGANIISQKVKYSAGHDLQFISENGSASIADQQYTSWQFENYLTYRRKFWDRHAFTGMFGASWQKVDIFSSSVSAENFLDDYFGFNNLGVATNPRPPASGASTYSLNSYFSRINYVVAERYLLTATGRLDGSSRFAKNNRYAFFPSIALGWRISEESFMRDLPITNLKLRASYGITGNSEIPNYQTVTGLGNYSYILNGQRVAGIGISRMGNPNLKWEKNNQLDVGLELGILNGRISFEGDLYYRRSNDILLNAPVPASSGYTSVTRNIGSMENRGLELGLNTVNIHQENFSWNTHFNISINRNKVLRLTGGQDIVQGTNPVTGLRIIREGAPVNSFYGFIQLGTWGTEQEAEANRYNRLPGDIQYLDVNNDGAINESDRVIIGNGEPRGYGSFVNNLKYKRFELMVDFQFIYGNDVSFDTKATSQDRVGITNVLADVLNAWTPENQATIVPQIRPVGGYKDRESSSGRIYDGSFIRGRNLLLAYNFSPGLVRRIGGRNLRLYAAWQNFLLVTDYPGYDPEVSSLADNFSQGTDLYSYPKPRTIQFGLNYVL